MSFCKPIFILLILTITLSVSCAGNFDIFPTLGANMSSPIELAIDSTRGRLYINNSNYRVEYDDGSIHVVSITDPTNPVRVDYLVLPSFNGQLYLDPVAQFLYTPNRFSSTETARADNLFRVNVNEAATDFLARSDYTSTDDPYGIACCDAENRILTASEQGFLDYYDLDDNLAAGSLSLTSNLDTGVQLSGQGATRVVIIGSWGVVTRSGGGLWLVNLNELGVTGTVPIDYFIGDIEHPKGIATDGTFVYVVSQDFTASPAGYFLYVLDLSTLAAVTTNTTTQVLDKDDDALLIATTDLVEKDPREIVLAGATAFVSHFTDDLLSVVELVGYTRTGEIGVGDEPYGMAVYSPAGTPTHLAVSNSGDNTISIIDLTTNAIVGTYP